MEQETVENIVDEGNNMTFGSVFKSMLPSVIIGTAAGVGAQEIASHYTSNPEAITMAGMVSQYVGAYGVYFPAHLYNNRDSLIENGRVKWKEYAQDISSVLVSDRVGNKVWAGAYGLANEIALRSGVDPAIAGSISGISSGLVYSVFTGLVAPKVNIAIDKTKKMMNKIRNSKFRRELKCHQVDLAKKQ